MSEIISKLDNQCFLIIAFTMLVMGAIVAGSYKYAKDILKLNLERLE